MVTELDTTQIKKREPFFNMPRVIVVCTLILLLIHGVRIMLSPELQESMLLHFAFFPMAYHLEDEAHWSLLDGLRLWSPFTYSLLHLNWMHVIVNVLWFVVFGTPVAYRFGARRFLLFCTLCAPFGALAHYLSFGPNGPPVIGASAVVSGLTAAALRFAFSYGGGLQPGATDPSRFRRPAPTLLDNLRERQVFAFFIVWLVINILFGIGGSVLSPDMQVAWQAHLGGFIGGLILFQLLDPIDPKQLSSLQKS